MLDILLPKLHREGQKFLTISLILTFILLLFSKFLGFLGIIISIWVFYFFRDPDRHPILDNNFLVAPADGMICQIENEVSGPKEMSMENDKFTKVSVFMNVFNCHVNRFPIDCKVNEVFYKPGDFVNASLDDASTNNERNLIKITSVQNDEIIVTQVAGLVARRIVSYCNNTENYKQGQSFGIIRFGSRVDLFFKNNFKVLVKKGQTVIGGETLLASREI
ncbi:MAG: phosphatidylserine decarboxylase family protein [Pelagibacteraceae bacterium]|jgi:phosphatidylserine decarboxylase|nr:phosphatidylserine decarboxylase family protein [Pelagibacteraceae bacterium]|tara:strand:- start:58 stop:717 length:660 start_codon:yes stop_codon:yes gene_type:complete